MRMVINIHSFIDVITNSSTELFVSNEWKTIEEVKSIIEETCPMLDGYIIRWLTEDEKFLLEHINELTKKKGLYYWYDYKLWYPKKTWILCS